MSRLRALAPLDVAHLIAQTLDGRAAWVAPELSELLERAGVESTHAADVALVAADAITPEGGVVVAASGIAPTVPAVWALIRGDRLPIRETVPTFPRAERVFFGLGVLEVRDEGLVLVAVAPHVSARDVQGRVAGRLWVASSLQTIDVPGRRDAKMRP